CRRRRDHRRLRQRLGGGRQPQRRGRGSARGVAPHAHRNRVHAPRPGTHHRRAQDRDHRTAWRYPQLTDPPVGQTHPPHRRLRPTHLRLQLPRADRQPTRRGDDRAQTDDGGALLMTERQERATSGERPIGRVMAQVAMVMNLDKCIGCHTCSVTCKQACTNRKGTEYVWFNNVETRPGQGYPRGYEDQEKWQGGWALSKNGRLKLKAGGKLKKLASILSNPKLPRIEDYYEPWSYEYDTLLSAPDQEDIPTAPPKSLLTGERM